MQIIGVGFGRTGTLSTCTALNELGFSCYHMLEVLENRRNRDHLDFWLKVANEPAGTQHDWTKVFSDYNATVDNPGCCVWRELLVCHPRAKVILTLHPEGPESWYQSTIETIYAPQKMWQFKLLSWFSPKARKMRQMSQRLIWQRSHEGTMEDEELATARYDEHIEEVKDSVPSDRLLIYSVDQGWEPLCNFLDLPIPENDFPKVNERAKLKKKLSSMAASAYLILAIGTGLFAGILYWGATRFL